MVPHEVEAALAGAEQPGRGREDAEDGYHYQHQQYYPYHLVALGVLEEIPECLNYIKNEKNILIT